MEQEEEGMKERKKAGGGSQEGKSFFPLPQMQRRNLPCRERKGKVVQRQMFVEKSDKKVFSSPLMRLLLFGRLEKKEKEYKGGFSCLHFFFVTILPSLAVSSFLHFHSPSFLE